MIEIRCRGDSKALLTDMTPFQGESKKRSEQDIDDLCLTLREDGLIQPFSLWLRPEDQKLMILDGHGRMQAMIKMAMTDPSILSQEFPVNLTVAETEDEAKKACVQCISMYGKVSKIGITKFAATIADYKAPILVRAQMKPVKIEHKVTSNDKVIIRISIDKSKVSELVSILKQVDGVEVL